MAKRLIEWFENGDLVPMAVIISVAHYGPVLVAHGEHWFVAWVVGALIDLLHFRSVRYAFSARQWLAAGVAIITTVMAAGYHLRFYGNDWLLALPIPIGIAILAWHASEKETVGIAAALAQAQAQLQDTETKLQERDRTLQGLETKLQETATRLQERDRALQEVGARLQETETRWQSLGAAGKDFIKVVAGEMPQAELAKKHGITESSVSRVKAMLNGGVKK